MKKTTVRNLVIGSIALLGISYVVENHIKNKKRHKEIKNSQEKKELEELENDSTRRYHQIGNIVKENDKFAVKELKKVI